MRNNYPIAHCPNCHRTVLYSADPKDKKNVKVYIAEADYHGTMMLCGKCKSMLAIIENPKKAEGYVVLPIIREARATI